MNMSPKPSMRESAQGLRGLPSPALLCPNKGPLLFVLFGSAVPHMEPQPSSTLSSNRLPLRAAPDPFAFLPGPIPHSFQKTRQNQGKEKTHHKAGLGCPHVLSPTLPGASPPRRRSFQQLRPGLGEVLREAMAGRQRVASSPASPGDGPPGPEISAAHFGGLWTGKSPRWAPKAQPFLTHGWLVSLSSS